MWTFKHMHTCQLKIRYGKRMRMPRAGRLCVCTCAWILSPHWAVCLSLHRASSREGEASTKTLKELVSLGAHTQINIHVRSTGSRYRPILESTAAPPGPPCVSHCLNLLVIPQVPSSWSSPLQCILSLSPVHPHSKHTHIHCQQQFLTGVQLTIPISQRPYH